MRSCEYNLDKIAAATQLETVGASSVQYKAQSLGCQLQQIKSIRCTAFDKTPETLEQLAYFNELDKSLRNVKNTLSHFLHAAEYTSFFGFRVGMLNTKDIHVLEGFQELTALIIDDHLDKRLDKLCQALPKTGYDPSLYQIWGRRVLYLILLLGVIFFAFTLAMLIFTPVTSILALPGAALLSVIAFGAFFCLRSVVMQPVIVEASGISLTSHIPVFTTGIPVLQTIILPWLLRLQIASWSIEPPREKMAHAAQAAIFEFAANELRNCVIQLNTNLLNAPQTSLLQALDTAQCIHQKGVDSIFEEQRQSRIKKAHTILQTVAKVLRQIKETEKTNFMISPADQAILDPPPVAWHACFSNLFSSSSYTLLETDNDTTHEHSR